MARHLFISYAKQDGPFAERVRAALEARGVTCWFAPRDIAAGTEWDEAIIDGIEDSSALLLVLSRHSNASPFVQSEVSRAFSKNKPVLTVRAEEVLPAKPLELYTGRRQWFDAFANLLEDGVGALAKAVKAAQPADPGPHRVARPSAVLVSGPVKRHSAGFFRGRATELSSLHRCLRNPEFRLAAVCGRGGAGKTALVTRLLVDLEKEPFQPGLAIVFVALNQPECRSLTYVVDRLAEVLPPHIAADLGEAWRRNATLEDRLALILRRTLTASPLLIVLDNLEDILDTDDHIAGAYRDLETFIATCVENDHCVRLLVTSRRGFLLPPDVEAHIGHRRLDLSLDEGLPHEDALALLRDLDATGTCRLKDAPHEQLQQIATACFGIPRTLEVVVAQLRAKPTLKLQQFIDSPKHLASLVDNPARVLFESLTSSERKIMEVMAVFDRPVSVGAIAALATDGEIDETMNMLVRHHAVDFDDDRFTIHALDQQFVYHQLQADAATRLHAAAADHLLAQCKPRSEWKALADLEPQVAAFEHLFRASRFDDACRLLNEIDREYLAVWGHGAMVVGWRERLEGHLTDERLKSLNQGNLGANYLELGELQRSADSSHAALEIARALGLRSMECRWQGNYATAVSCLGQQPTGRKLLEQALQLAIDIDDKLHIGRWTYKIGEIQAEADPEGAIETWKRALAATRAAADPRFESFCLSNLGRKLHELTRNGEAAEYLRQAVDVARSIGAGSAAFESLHILAAAQGALHGLPAQVATYMEAADEARGLSDKAAEGRTLTRLAIALKTNGDLEGCMRVYDQANQVASEVREHTSSVVFLDELADLNIALDRPEEAVLNIEEALRVATLIGDRSRMLQLTISAGSAASLLRDFRRAAGYFERAVAMARELGDRGQEAIALFDWADACHSAGDTESAESGYTQALVMNNEATDTKSLLGLGVLQAQRGEDASARDNFSRCAELCRTRLRSCETTYLAYTLALALLGSGEAVQALQAFEHAVKVDGSLKAVQYAIQDVELVQRGRPPIDGIDSVRKLLAEAQAAVT